MTNIFSFTYVNLLTLYLVKSTRIFSHRYTICMLSSSRKEYRWYSEKKSSWETKRVSESKNYRTKILYSYIIVVWTTTLTRMCLRTVEKRRKYFRKARSSTKFNENVHISFLCLLTYILMLYFFSCNASRRCFSFISSLAL